MPTLLAEILRARPEVRGTLVDLQRPVAQSAAVFEAAGVLALHAFGISQSAAFPYALVLHVSNFVPLVLVGAITLHSAARQPSQMRGSATYT